MAVIATCRGRSGRALDELLTGLALMHPLPRDGRRGPNDLSTGLHLDPRLVNFRQTDNGIPVRMALVAVLLGGEQ